MGRLLIDQTLFESGGSGGSLQAFHGSRPRFVHAIQGISAYLGLGLSATKMRLYRAFELFEALLLSERR